MTFPVKTRRRYRRNAKFDPNLLIIIAVGWYAYTKGWLKSILGDIGQQVPPGTQPPPGTPPPSGTNCDFVTNYRYVATYGSGYIVVWKGAQYNGIYATQAEAEAAYRGLVAAQGCV